MSYSQFNQDINILNFYNDKKFGFFVEAGAQDGCNYSNSYYLEKNNYWNGICVECNPYWYNKLCNNRKNTLNYNYALYNSDDDSLDFINDNIGGCSGILETNKNNNVLHNNEIIKVNTKKLTTILDMANAPSFIEFLSLDTEGSEYEILKSHDFNKYLFGYICVEHNYIKENREKIRSLLESKGYIFYRENYVDDDYYHNSLKT